MGRPSVLGPTLAGIRAGRDEVLETAVGSLLGEGVSKEEIRRWVDDALGARR